MTQLHIVKEGDKYILYSKKTHKRLGEFSTLEEAKKRERQIEYFKHRGKQVSAHMALAYLQDFDI